MELSEETQECPYCGLTYTDFEFHIRIHDDCKKLEEQRKALGRKRESWLSQVVVGGVSLRVGRHVPLSKLMFCGTVPARSWL